jgi:hypothetical protein
MIVDFFTLPLPLPSREGITLSISLSPGGRGLERGGIFILMTRE